MTDINDLIKDWFKESAGTLGAMVGQVHRDMGPEIAMESGDEAMMLLLAVWASTSDKKFNRGKHLTLAYLTTTVSKRLAGEF